MIVPQYWAEARIQKREQGKQITVRRFGWSDENQVAAQQHAQQRAEEAYARIARGEKLPRRDLKIPYNGADGIPIREEILDRHEDAVITRNSYGAHCLNTPDVLFADIDFYREPERQLYIILIIGLLISSALIAWWFRSWSMLFVLFVLSLISVSGIAIALQKMFARLRGGAEVYARKRLDQFIAAHPDWHLRLYRTPAGFRVLAMHKLFNTCDDEVVALFKALDVDPLYVRMCQNQRCFRARLTAKPWRIGISDHMRPRPGVWPINPDRRADRERWVSEYEKAREKYAACRFVESLGSKDVHPKARSIQRLHDEQCRAETNLPIA